jgi:hypothetical protein
MHDVLSHDSLGSWKQDVCLGMYRWLLQGQCYQVMQAMHPMRRRQLCRSSLWEYYQHRLHHLEDVSCWHLCWYRIITDQRSSMHTLCFKLLPRPGQHACLYAYDHVRGRVLRWQTSNHVIRPYMHHLCCWQVHRHGQQGQLSIMQPWPCSTPSWPACLPKLWSWLLSVCSWNSNL